MKQEYEILFTPAKIGTCEIKNRFVMAAMEGTTLLGWHLGKGYDPGARDLLIDRAKDGVGLIITGATFITSATKYEFVGQHPEAFAGVQDLMDEIHSYGTKCFFQLSAGAGRIFPLPKAMYDNLEATSKAFKLDKFLASADAGLPNVWIPEYKTKQLSAGEVEALVQGMADAAYLCKENGVDGVEVHALHEGYLMDQFALKYTNHRTDKYGGPLENRLRFALEVVKAIKSRCGADFPVILRYSVTSRTKGFNEGIIPQDMISREIGRTMEESEKAVGILTEAGYDAFDGDNGTYDAWYYAHPPVYMPLNCNLNAVEHIKEFTDKPVICSGRMQLDDAARSISAGKTDMVGIARQFLTDEKYLTKVREDQEEDIRPCISCHVGCFPVGLWKNHGADFDLNKAQCVCALNPRTRQEKKYTVVPAKESKAIAVIGGGIAGMEFALQAVKRGHTVTIYEKSDNLGGVFNQAARFTFKEKDRDLLTYYRTQIQKSSVNVKYNTEIHSLTEIEEDELVIATGALRARTLPDPGGCMVTALDFLKGDMDPGDKVAVIGGGLTGCEIAYELALKGKHPYIIEMMDDILEIPGSCMANTNFLRDAFKYYGVDLYTSAKVEDVRKGFITVLTETGEDKTLEMDDCIVSIGYEKGIPFKSEDTGKHVYTIGDADKVANLMNAIWSANDLVIEHFQ